MRAPFAAATWFAAFLVSACTTVGGGTGSPASGSAGPSGSQGSVALHRCSAPIATISIATEQQPTILISYGLPGNPLPAMRLLAQQTNCFRIVNRDVALQTMETERALQQQGQLRKGSNFGGGQIIAADYTIMVEVLVNNSNSGGIGAAALGFIPYVGGVASLVAGGMRFQEAQVLLTLVNNHTSEQMSTATGKGSGTSFSLGGAGLTFVAAGAAGGYMDTDQGKVVMAAMVDGLNQIEPQIQQLNAKR